jgi:replication factor C subunit 3/5
MSNILPWIEKYRPTDLSNIVLSSENKCIFNNIIEDKYFPHLLLYGPPGTGKTTTIINLINEYLKKVYGISNNDESNIIHLNASDDRGVEIIRNQIYNFVNSKGLYNNEIKFVILDEVDYMTKSAQISLKTIIKRFNNVRFCLICNYISKIIKPLKNIMLKLYFCNNDEKRISNILKYILNNEGITNKQISNKTLLSIIRYFETDIRSMINTIQIISSGDDKVLNGEYIKENIHNKFVNLVDNNIGEKIINLDKKIKKFLEVENVYFNLLLSNYFSYLIEKHKYIDVNIIENIKYLYEDSINSLDVKVNYFVYMIIEPLYNNNK